MGLSRSDIDELTPLELSLAIEEHENYNSVYMRQLTELVRYSGLTLRNKGVRLQDMIRNTHKYFPLFWDKKKNVEIPNWRDLDKKYKR